MRFMESVEIVAEPERIWAVLLDVEHWPEWTESVRTVERLDQGPLEVGSLTRLVQPRLRPSTWRVTELVAPQSFTWVSSGGGVTTVGGHRLTPLAAGRVGVELSIDQSGPLAPLVGLVGAALIRRYLRFEADGLKRRCESPSD
jgi:uncharacterized membrane protein